MSCDCNCPEKTIVDFSINNIGIQLLDNAGNWNNRADSTQTFSPKAIAFQIILSDTALGDEYLYMSSLVKPIRLFAFKQSFAFSCDCDFYDYYYDNKIDSIEIRTVFDYSPNRIAGSNVSAIVLSASDNIPSDNLYLTKCNLIEIINQSDIINDPSISFSLFLTEEAQNELAQFEIIIHLLNGESVHKLSPIIHLS